MKLARWLFMVLLFSPAAGLSLTFAQDSPQEETVRVVGLDDTVEILRDQWGIPHIYASSSRDLFFAQGYTQAQDRWWQMEWWRHIGSGRLSELAGRSLLGQDIFIRTLGGRAVVEQELETLYDAESLSYLQAFADGVNAYILKRQPGELAMQYSALGLAGMEIEVEAWTPADTLIWGKVMAFSLGGNMGIEMLLSELSSRLSQEMIDQFAPPFPYGRRPTILLPEDLPISAASQSSAALSDSRGGIRGGAVRLAGSVPPMIDLGLGRGAGTGSNNWVVSGALTQSGRPLLANDPHLTIQMPSIWYQVGLHCRPVNNLCPFNVMGFTFSTSPGVVIGHNERIAWGMTNSIADVQDLYQMRVNPDNPLQYEWNGGWRDMTVREETIHFGDGGEAVTIQVRETHLGPIISDHALVDGQPAGWNNDSPLALRWTALQPGALSRAVLELNRAADWDGFRAALRYWDTPAQNIVYADVDGSIGYQLPGSLPVRAAGHTGLLPVPGWTDEFEWRGFIPYDDLPRVFNPQRGYIASANQAIVPLEYYDQLAARLDAQFGGGSNFAFGYYFAYGYRAQRITDLLAELAPHSVETFAQMQGDNKNLSAEELIPYLGALEFDDSDLGSMRDWLMSWDYRMDQDSPQAALYGLFWLRLMDHLFNDQLADVLRASGNDNYLQAVFLLMETPENLWWDDTRTPDLVEQRDDILRRSLTEAYAAAVEQLGEEQEGWSWGALHTAAFISDPLGQSGNIVAERLVNRGPVAISGGSEIVNATGWDISSGSLEAVSIPSMRLIVDLADFDNSRAINATGQSGHPLSPHYDDMIDPWRRIEYHALPFTPAAVEAAARSRLTLTPER